MEPLKQLEEIRQYCGKRRTKGLADKTIEDFSGRDNKLNEAIAAAYKTHTELRQSNAEELKLDEQELIDRLQKGLVNFYPEDQTNPYVALCACGPWLVTTHGAVLHDNGGYGMLGFGHQPTQILQAMHQHHVMANIMTASFSQKRLVERLRQEIGHTRNSDPSMPSLSHFICMNSGSEAMTVACRIADIHARLMTQDGAPHEGKRIMQLAIKGGFHGRTDRPASISSSTRAKYEANLASFRELDNLRTLPPNDIAALEASFKWAENEGVFFDAMFMEPVMGEGDPGLAVVPEFFAAARELTEKHQTMLVVDSIQAAIRAQGCLSICDYPGFSELPPPDMETYSKALNAGQYPLSILGMVPRVASLYVKGVYGNTMTTNPRALEVACAVLDHITPELRQNIVERGQEFLAGFRQLAEEFPDIITKIQGTGLLCSCEVSPQKFAVVGFGQLEEYMRTHGIGVIHGGENSLRFTPHFEITSAEVQLVIDAMRDAFKNGPRKSS